MGGGGGVLKAKVLEAMYENRLKFPGGRRGHKTKNLSWEECGYFLELHIYTFHTFWFGFINTTACKHFLCMY